MIRILLIMASLFAISACNSEAKLIKSPCVAADNGSSHPCQKRDVNNWIS